MIEGDSYHSAKRKIARSLPAAKPNPFGLENAAREVEARQRRSLDLKLNLWHCSWNRRRKMNGQIFISYRREDTSAWAGRLYDNLRRHFVSNQIFMDVDLEPGLDFFEAIETSVGSCDVLIAVIGKRWLITSNEEGKRRLENSNDYVRLENCYGSQTQRPSHPCTSRGSLNASV